MLIALKCPSCAGALPAPAPGVLFVQCIYCGATTQLARAADPYRQPGQQPPPAEPRGPTPGREELQRFGEAYAQAAEQGLLAALHTAAREALGAWGDQREMIFAVAHLATDFTRESGCAVARDGMVMMRLAEAYYRASLELMRVGETDLNLPFLTADGSGPKHLVRKLTAADLARISSAPPQ